MKKITEKLFEDTENEKLDIPDVLVKEELVPYRPTPEVIQAMDDFHLKLREAFSISPADWPKGRTFELSLKFAVVPISLDAKFGKK